VLGQQIDECATYFLDERFLQMLDAWFISAEQSSK
jgi:hypothetical protein